MAKKTTTSTPKKASPAVAPASPAAPVSKPAAPKRLVAARAVAPAPKPASIPARAAVAGTNGKSPKATAPAAQKAAAKPVAPKPAAKRPGVRKPKALPPITYDDIALRAYLIAEKRQAHGHHGDPHTDWVEAERQLQAERAGAQ